MKRPGPIVGPPHDQGRLDARPRTQRRDADARPVLIVQLPRYRDRSGRLAAVLAQSGFRPVFQDAEGLAAVAQVGVVRVLDEAGHPVEPIAVLHTLWGARVAGHAIDLLQARGATVLNTVAATGRAADKFATALALGDAGLAQPASALSWLPATDGVLAGVFGWPVVLKRLDGSGGKSVFLARTPAELDTVAARLRHLAPFQPILVQEYVPQAHGRDIRAFVVGGEVVASIERVAADPDTLTANLAQGGSGHAISLSAPERAIAIDATRALGLDYAGVDLVTTPRGPLILEVNGEPGTAGVESVVGPIVVPAIVRHLVRRLDGATA